MKYRRMFLLYPRVIDLLQFRLDLEYTEIQIKIAF